MDDREVAKRLKALAQLDIDAVHAYKQAIEKIDMSEIREALESFCADHERHVSDLEPLIRKCGEEPPAFNRDFKGFFIEGMTALRSVTGTEGALKAMKMNEALTNERYEAALNEELPKDVREVVQRNREDERRHLNYIEQCLEEEPWESGKRTGTSEQEPAHG